MTAIATPLQICGVPFSTDSKMKCIRDKDHAGSHSFMIGEPDHTYYIERYKGMFACCMEYLSELITKADLQKWPRFPPGFETCCTTCQGWMKLKGDTFVYDYAKDKGAI